LQLFDEMIDKSMMSYDIMIKYIEYIIKNVI